MYFTDQYKQNIVGDFCKEGKTMKVDSNKLWFIQGILVSTCANRQTITYDELRRLCRLNDKQLGTYLGEARDILSEDEPDYCSVVVKTTGVPGEGWGKQEKGPARAIKAQQRFWQDRRNLDNKEFEKTYGSLPTIPGLSSE